MDLLGQVLLNPDYARTLCRDLSGTTRKNRVGHLVVAEGGKLPRSLCLFATLNRV